MGVPAPPRRGIRLSERPATPELTRQPRPRREGRHRTRHVWVDLGDNRCQVEGLVLFWAQSNGAWEVLVVRVEADPAAGREAVIEQWLPAAQLTPVHHANAPSRQQ